LVASARVLALFDGLFGVPGRPWVLFGRPWEALVMLPGFTGAHWRRSRSSLEAPWASFGAAGAPRDRIGIDENHLKIVENQ